MFLLKMDRIVACNHNAEILFRQSVEQLSGQSIFNYFPERQPDGYSSAETLDLGLKSMEPGKVSFFHWTHLDKHKLPFDAQVTLTALVIHRELVFQYVISDVQDSSAQTKINQPLLELAETSSDVMLISDRNGHIEWVNSAFTDTTGYSFNEVYKKDPVALLHSSGTSSKTINTISKALAKEKSVKAAEIMNFSKDGNTFGMLLDIKPIKNRDGAMENQIWVGYNINKKKPVAKSASSSEQRFKDLVRQSPVGIFMYEINYRHELVLIESNQAANDILGLNTFDLIGLTIEEAFPCLIGTDLPELYIKTARTGKPLQLGDIHYDEGGIHGDFQVNAFQAGKNRVAVTFLDITARKRAENEIIKKNEELTKLNTELDHFVYSASHDLRAPIVSLLGVTRLMRLEKEPGKISHLLDMQEKSLARLDYFISEIVTYSKNSRLNLKREAIDFRHEVNGIFADVNFMDGMNKIRKEVNVKQQEHFYSDIRRVRVILNNLITNAIKYRDQEKKDSFIKIDVVVNSEAAEIIIADNGIGIPSELHDKVFDMFFRGSETSKGSGLGLYIVAEVIKKIKGKISIVSSPKEGTTFKLMLPQFN